MTQPRTIRAESAAVTDLLRRALARTLAPTATDWLDAEIDRARGADERRLAIALGLVGRKVGRRDLSLEAEDIAAARALRADWQPERWGTDEAARVMLLLAADDGNEERFAARVDRLCATAEVTELVAYLKGFAVFPAARALHDRAREGVRSSMRPVFEAIASHNPYPFDHFDLAAWNQMVVKAVFTGVPIETIVGLHQRRNAEGVQMLRDLVSERRAAGRPSPDVVHTYIAED
jgi:hypothetical protein